MKREILGFGLAAVALLTVGIIGGRNVFPKECPKVEIRGNYPDNKIVLIPTDTIDGRPVYDVVLKNDSLVEHMYSEEIANSLNTGKWQYDEMLRIEGEQ
jgi:hypothetical protein